MACQQEGSASADATTSAGEGKSLWGGPVAAIRTAAAAIFGDDACWPSSTQAAKTPDCNQPSSSAQAADRLETVQPLLEITSPCAGSMTRIAELRSDSSQFHRDACAGPVWDGFCAVCKRPISIAPAAVPHAKRSRVEKGRCAYVITLWGSSPEYVLGAMVLGWSLRRTQTPHDMVVVHTSDVSSAALDLLQQVGWIPREVEHIDATTRLAQEGCENMRFAKVFTKLRVLELVEYSKILMLDIDLLVRENVDHLFDVQAPAAMVRGPEVRYEHGGRVYGRYFFCGSRDDRYSWGQASGINAGVMLLQPDAEVFQQMLLEVRDSNHPEHIRGNGPEQDYLSRFYTSDWHHLSVAYNFQLHHMYFALSPAYDGIADRTKFILNSDLIKIIHYSSEPKPWSRLLEEQYRSYTDEQWLEEVLLSFSGYRAWVLKDPECMKPEGERNGLKFSKDGTLHKIDWSRVKPRYTWTEDSEEKQKTQAQQVDSESQAILNGSEKENATNKQSIEEKENNEKLAEDTLNGKEQTDEARWSWKWQQDADAADQGHTNDEGLWSEDGWPLGPALVVSEDAVVAAKSTLQMAQDVWFKAYRDLAEHLGKDDLATAVKTVMSGPVIRQNWDWSSNHYAVSEKLDSEDREHASKWSRDGTGGWWVEQPVAGRFVATCSSLPQKQVSLIAGDQLLFAATCEGVHVAAVSPTGAECPAARSFTAEDGSIDAAAAWASAVPVGAMVLLAAINSIDDTVSDICHAMANAGLGCPHYIPSNYAVAAAVGLKEQEDGGRCKKWYTTHAAAIAAMASCPGFGDAATPSE